MAITQRGSSLSSFANNGGNATLNLSGLSLQENDVVVISCAAPRVTGNTPAVVSAGWTPVVTAHLGSTTNKISIGAWYKRMGVTPDGSVEVSGDGSANTDTTVIGIAFSGVDTTTALDQTPTTAGETVSTNPDPPSIVTQTDGAQVVVIAGMADNVLDSAVTPPSGYTGNIEVNGSDTQDHTHALATKNVATAGTENPASWTNWNSGGWYCITLALKPQGQTINQVEFVDASLALTSATPDTVKLTKVTNYEDASLALTSATPDTVKLSLKTDFADTLALTSLTSTPALSNLDVLPTVALNTADATDFVVEDMLMLEFTGSEGDSNPVLYELQVDTSPTFDSQSGSPLYSKVSGTDIGFGDTTTEQITNGTFDSNITPWTSSSMTETHYPTDTDGIGRINLMKCVGLGTVSQRVDIDFAGTVASGTTVRISGNVYLPSTNGLTTRVEFFDYYTATQIFGYSGTTENSWVNKTVLQATLAEIKDGLGIRLVNGTSSTVTLGDTVYLDDISWQTYASNGEYVSGNKVSFVFGVTFTDDTKYYWRVRAKAPAGANEYGSWSETRYFNVGTPAGAIEFTDTLNLTSATSDAKLNRITAYTDTLALDSLTSTAKLNRVTAYTDTLGLTSLTSSAKLSLLNAYADTLNMTSLTSNAKLNKIVTYADTLGLTSLTGDASFRRINQFADTLNLTSLTSDAKLTLVKVFADTLALTSLTSNAKLSLLTAYADTLGLTSLTSSAKLQLLTAFSDTLNLTSLTSTFDFNLGNIVQFADTVNLTSLTSSAKLKLIANFTDTLALTSLTSDAKLYKLVTFLDTLALTSLTSTPDFTLNNIVSFADTLNLTSLSSDVKLTLVKTFSDTIALTSLTSTAKLTKIVSFLDTLNLSSLTGSAELSLGAIVNFADTLNLTSLTSTAKLNRIINYIDTIAFTSLTSSPSFRRLMQYADTLNLTSLTANAKLYRFVLLSGATGFNSLTNDPTLILGGQVYYTDTLNLTSLTSTPKLTMSIPAEIYYWDGTDWVQLQGLL